MSAGLVKSRCKKMREVMAGHAEQGEMPGLVTLVSCGDDLEVEAFGKLSFAGAKVMERDSIFRIASLSKPIAAAAVMMLVEDCRLRLSDRVETWLPELANRKVLRSLQSELEDTVPARRAITVRDVLTYTMGFGSVMAPPGTGPIQKSIAELSIGGDGPQLPTQMVAMDEWLKRVGSLPLLAQPGERWMYHVSGDVLGALVARVSGKSFGDFLSERIFGPLGMKDTGFHLKAEDVARVPDFYRSNHATGKLEIFDSAANSAWLEEPRLESGGGGLLSTVDDYFAFCRMMLNEGRHGSEQLLSRAAVQLMTSDQVTAEQRAGAGLFFGDFSSWGLGMAVDTARREVYHSPGRFGWTGGFGTTAYTDPVHQMIGVLFTQRMMDSPELPRVFTDFWTLAYGAMKQDP